MNSLITTAVALVIAALIAWGAVSFRRGVGVALVIAAMLAMGTLSPVPADALEIRQAAEGDVLRIAAGETIDDTLIALADTVEIDGIVEGDLIAVGRVVVIRGRVAGQLVAIAQSVTVSGVVEGSVLGLGQTVNVSAEQIGRNLFGFGSTVSTASATRVGQNAVVAGRVHLAGTVDRDVVGFGQDLEIGSAIGGDLTAWASSVTLLSSASVGGNFSAHVPEETAVSISPEATVAGEQTIDIEERAEDQSEYGTIGFYFRQLLRFAAAFITGLILLALVPRLQRVGPTSALDGLIACGIGLIALAAVPVIAVIAAITVIGIPMALLTVMLYVVGVYLAKIVVAHFIGRTLIARNGTARPFAAALAVGLVLVLVVVNLPFVGGWLNFILTIGGLGLIVRFVWDRARGAPAYA